MALQQLQSAIRGRSVWRTRLHTGKLHSVTWWLPKPPQHVAQTARLRAAEDPDKADIDQLASLLSQKAAELRNSYSDEELDEELASSDSGEPTAQAPPPASNPFGAMAPVMEQQILANLGSEAFSSDDFELLQQLGRLSVQKDSGSYDDGEPQTAVIAFAARYVSRLPYENPVMVLVKEYLPTAKAVACNELLLNSHLCGLPGNKHKAAVANISNYPPLVPLLGYFCAAPSESAQQYGADGDNSEAASSALWLVYKWERMLPLSAYMDSGPPSVAATLFWNKQAAAAGAWRSRSAMLRAVARGVLEALAFCHERGVAHGSLSAGAVLLSSADDERHDSLLVKLDGLGFGRLCAAMVTAAAGAYGSGGGGSSLASQPSAPSAAVSAAAVSGASMTPLAVGPEEFALHRRADLQSAGLLMAEAFAVGLMDSGGADSPLSSSDAAAAASVAGASRAALQRLLFDVFHADVAAFRQYCSADPLWERFVAFLDDRNGAGWAFLGDMMGGEVPASVLLTSEFLAR